MLPGAAATEDTCPLSRFLPFISPIGAFSGSAIGSHSQEGLVSVRGAAIGTDECDAVESLLMEAARGDAPERLEPWRPSEGHA